MMNRDDESTKFRKKKPRNFVEIQVRYLSQTCELDSALIITNRGDGGLTSTSVLQLWQYCMPSQQGASIPSQSLPVPGKKRDPNAPIPLPSFQREKDTCFTLLTVDLATKWVN